MYRKILIKHLLDTFSTQIQDIISISIKNIFKENLKNYINLEKM